MMKLLLVLFVLSIPVHATGNESKKQKSTIPYCEILMSIDAALLAGTEGKQKSVTAVFTKNFPEQNRQFLVFQFQVKGFVPRPIYLHKTKLRFALIDTENNRVIWQFDDFLDHKPLSFELSSVNPNTGILNKLVTRLFPHEEAPASARPRPDLQPWDVSSDIVDETLQVSVGANGRVKITEL